MTCLRLSLICSITRLCQLKRISGILSKFGSISMAGISNEEFDKTFLKISWGMRSIAVGVARSANSGISMISSSNSSLFISNALLGPHFKICHLTLSFASCVSSTP